MLDVNVHEDNFSMTLASRLNRFLLLKTLFLHLLLVAIMAEERRACSEQEYKDQFGNCIACRQCDAGQELSKECGFGYGEDAHCVPCKVSRFKEDQSSQKCKPCLDCANLNRFQKANCSSTRNAVCGECLSGFYRKTKLSGFQDMECIPCGDPPPPYEPHCIGRVNLVPIPSTVTSPRDMALAAVICSALATVLMALFILCIIYCKRQLLEKKPASLRSQDGSLIGAELSYLDRRQALDFSQRSCCYCQHIPEQTCAGPVHLLPSVCCEDTCGQRLGRDNSPFQSQSSLNERLVRQSAWNSQCDFEQAAEPLPVEFSEELPLMEKAVDRTHLRLQPTNSSNSSSEEDMDELSSTKLSSELLQDGSCLVEQHLSTVEE
ncbi:tumor necrosis factor receptor superfamily member 19 isoform X1 [Tachysurus fulvidraco]|uniref:tumor necrosis factor receptor superfamily member 19 isoform X1 n=1 Tax=Tachysurus fulvidraco TaxID=1234273 RepID=UPI000F4FDBCB|nr:tumor necrosis factor receptor superfamily member 19 isoform X1 [Tachysurus fulvidraco]